MVITLFKEFAARFCNGQMRVLAQWIAMGSPLGQHQSRKAWTTELMKTLVPENSGPDQEASSIHQRKI